MRRYITINEEIYVEFPRAINGSNDNFSVCLVPISEVDFHFTSSTSFSSNGCNSDKQNGERNEMQCEFSISHKNCNKDDDSLVGSQKINSGNINEIHKKQENTLLESDCSSLNSTSESNSGLTKPLTERLDEDFNDPSVKDCRGNEDSLENSDFDEPLVINFNENESLELDNAVIEKIHELDTPVKLEFKYIRFGEVDIKVFDYFPIDNFYRKFSSPDNSDDNSMKIDDSKFSEEKLVKCPYCSFKLLKGKVFKHLIFHIQPCFCSKCDSSVPLKKIRLHIRDGHIDAIRCLACAHHSQNEIQFKLHLLNVHKDKIIAQCSICGYALKKNNSLLSKIKILSKHVKHKHHQQTH